MDDNIKTFLKYLNLPTEGDYIVSPTSFYLVEGSWLITPKDRGIRITTTDSNTDVRDLKAYALFMRIISDWKYLIPHTEQVVESLIRRVTGCIMNEFTLFYGPDDLSVEVMATMVEVPCSDALEDKIVPRRKWRIDLDKKLLHRCTSNQWILEDSNCNVEDYYQDIAGCLILLSNTNQRLK